MDIKGVYNEFVEMIEDYFNSILDNTSYVKTLKSRNESLDEQLERSEGRLKLSRLEIDHLYEEIESKRCELTRMDKLEEDLDSTYNLVKHLKHDNRERKLLTLRLMKNYAEFVGAIIENTPLNNFPGALIDRYGSIVYATPSMKKLFYKDDDEVRGRSCLSYFEVDEDSRKKFSEFYTDPNAHEVEIISKLRKGEKLKRQGLVFSKISAPELDLTIIKNEKEENNEEKREIKIPVCTYVTTKRSRAVLKREVDKVSEKVRKSLNKISKKHSIDFGDIPEFGRV